MPPQTVVPSDPDIGQDLIWQTVLQRRGQAHVRPGQTGIAPFLIAKTGDYDEPTQIAMSKNVLVALVPMT